MAAPVPEDLAAVFGPEEGAPVEGEEMMPDEMGNDEALYRSAVEFLNRYKGRMPYADFIKSVGYDLKKTPDGVAWISTSISYRELNRMMRELIS